MALVILIHQSLKSTKPFWATFINRIVVIFNQPRAMLKVLKPASIYSEITRKLKFGSNSHIFVTVTNHDKMASFNPPQFFVRSYPLVNDRVREALGDTFYEEFMVRIQIDWSNLMKGFYSDTLKGRVYVMMRAMETIMHHMMSWNVQTFWLVSMIDSRTDP